MQTKSNFPLLIILAVVTSFAPLSIDLFAPALPAATRLFDTTVASMQNTIISFMLGYAIAPLIWGKLADLFGRRRIMLVGLSFYCVASICCLFSTSIEIFIFLRFIQGFGGSVGVVLGRVILRDVYGSKGATKAISSMFLLMAWIPVVLPAIGGYLAKYFDWQASFIMMVVISLISLFFSYRLIYETAPEQINNPGENRNWKGILTNKIFQKNTLLNMFCISIMLLFVSNYSHLTESIYHFTPSDNGYLLASFNAALALGVFLVRVFVPRYGIQRTIDTGVSLSLMAWLVVAILCFGSVPTLTALFVVILIGCLGIGMAISLSAGEALVPFSSNAGMASAIFVSIQAGGASLINYLYSQASNSSLASISIIMFICALFAGFFCFAWQHNTSS